MMSNLFVDIFCLYLVTCFCVTCGIITTNVSDSVHLIKSAPLTYGYLPPVSPTTFFDPLERVIYASKESNEQNYRCHHSRTLQSPSPNGDLRSPRLKDARASAKAQENNAKASRKEATNDRSYAAEYGDPPKSLYDITEEETYVKDEGSSKWTGSRHSTKDITAAVKSLDHFLSDLLNGNAYNSALHAPPNPLLALILSRYGRYVLGPRNSRLYSYMAANNIHNNMPFGRYKQERDNDGQQILDR